MPVEIRELIIRAVVTAEAQEGEERPNANQAPVDQEAIVQDCVRQIMNILNKKEER